MGEEDCISPGCMATQRSRGADMGTGRRDQGEVPVFILMYWFHFRGRKFLYGWRVVTPYNFEQEFFHVIFELYINGESFGFIGCLSVLFGFVLGS